MAVLVRLRSSTNRVLSAVDVLTLLSRLRVAHTQTHSGHTDPTQVRQRKSGLFSPDPGTQIRSGGYPTNLYLESHVRTAHHMERYTMRHQAEALILSSRASSIGACGARMNNRV